MKMVFLGPPGVGKGTHAGIAAEHFGVPTISTGQMFRDEMDNKTELGDQIREYMDNGELVPDEVVVNIIKDRVSHDDCKNGFILDGFPRTINQAMELDDIAHIDLVVNFVASHKTIIARISNRWTCTQCGAIYNTLFVKPKKEGICDECGSELYRREDQEPSVVEKRLNVYEKQTKPLIDYYKKRGILIDVNVEGEKEDVAKRIHDAIAEHFNSRKGK